MQLQYFSWKNLKRIFLVSLSCVLFSSGVSARVEYGFTPFPYDLTFEAMEKVHSIVLPNSSLYAIHLDQCLPWKESLEGKAYPKWLVNDWDYMLSKIPKDHTVYIAVTPSKTDRRTVATSCGRSDGDEGDWPAGFTEKGYDNPKMQLAYYNYVKRVVEKFNPKYINIGIEMSELALRHQSEWPRYASFYLKTKERLKREFPQLQIGMEFVLQSLMVPRVATLVKPVVEQSDYIGISFYPYGSEYSEFFGAAPLPSTKNGAQWKEPLKWLRNYTDKPIGIAETGYTSKDIFLNEAGGLNFPGSLQLQKAFVKDLVAQAIKDNYAFVVWFVAVDYEALGKKLGWNADNWKNIWINIGLFDSNLKPKPAWAEWLKFKNQ